MIADFITKDLNLDHKEFLQGLNTEYYDKLARTMWKAACSRGVQGTPTYFCNGVDIGADTWTAEQWSSFIIKNGKLNHNNLIK